MNKEEQAKVKVALGDGRTICDRCGATLETYPDVCTADLPDPCPGFDAIERAAWGRKERSA